MREQLPRALLDFVRHHVPTFQAAEFLVFLAGHRDRAFTAEEVVTLMRPESISVPDVREYVALFSGGGLVDASQGRFTFEPATPEQEACVAQLVAAYNERPVTLISEIYRLADGEVEPTA
jgi:hypothetical protein